MLIEKKQVWLSNTSNFQKIVYDWFFGDSFTLAFGGVGTKDIQIGVYDDKLQGIFLVAVKSTTDNSITIDLPNKEVRSIAITINAEDDLGDVTFSILSSFDVTSNAENLPANSFSVDSFVYHNSPIIKGKSVAFRVPDQEINTAKSLFQNKVYLDNILYQVVSVKQSELDIYNRLFVVSFVEVLNA